MRTLNKTITHKPATKFESSCLQGYVDAEYKTLVKVFGKAGKGDEYKTDAEWEVKFSDGTYATIYNYKDGKNYCGKSGLAKKDITDWHVGGSSTLAVTRVQDAINAYVDAQNAKIDEAVYYGA